MAVPTGGGYTLTSSLSSSFVIIIIIVTKFYFALRQLQMNSPNFSLNITMLLNIHIYTIHTYAHCVDCSIRQQLYQKKYGVVVGRSFIYKTLRW